MSSALLQGRGRSRGFAAAATVCSPGPPAGDTGPQGLGLPKAIWLGQRRARLNHPLPEPPKFAQPREAAPQNTPSVKTRPRRLVPTATSEDTGQRQIPGRRRQAVPAGQRGSTNRVSRTGGGHRERTATELARPPAAHDARKTAGHWTDSTRQQAQHCTTLHSTGKPTASPAAILVQPAKAVPRLLGSKKYLLTPTRWRG